MLSSLEDNCKIERVKVKSDSAPQRIDELNEEWLDYHHPNPKTEEPPAKSPEQTDSGKTGFARWILVIKDFFAGR